MDLFSWRWWNGLWKSTSFRGTWICNPKLLDFFLGKATHIWWSSNVFHHFPSIKQLPFIEPCSNPEMSSLCIYILVGWERDSTFMDCDHPQYIGILPYSHQQIELLNTAHLAATPKKIVRVKSHLKSVLKIVWWLNDYHPIFGELIECW